MLKKTPQRNIAHKVKKGRGKAALLEISIVLQRCLVVERKLL